MRVARLDSAGVYQGIEVIKKADFDSRIHIDLETIGGNCDLPPGKYRWNGETFAPLPKEARKPGPDVPTLEEVIYAIAKTMQNPPEDVKRWSQWFERTWDRFGRKR